jgi:hypothetical protein
VVDGVEGEDVDYQSGTTLTVRWSGFNGMCVVRACSRVLILIPFALTHSRTQVFLNTDS